jgi:hypothetical protein
MNNLYINDYNSIFFLDRHPPIYLGYTTIDRIMWRRSEIILRTKLSSETKFIRELKAGYSLVIKRQCPGMREDYSNGDTILILDDCQPVDFWIMNFVPKSPQDSTFLEMCARLKCKIIPVGW